MLSVKEKHSDNKIAHRMSHIEYGGKILKTEIPISEILQSTQPSPELYCRHSLDYYAKEIFGV